VSLPSIYHPTGRPNFSRVELGDGDLSVYFSYETPIAFNTRATGWVVRENEWGPTTGRHLNYVDDGSSTRVSGVEFRRLFEIATSNHVIDEEELVAA
jgi:hypothetical protein